MPLIINILSKLQVPTFIMGYNMKALKRLMGKVVETAVLENLSGLKLMQAWDKEEKDKVRIQYVFEKPKRNNNILLVFEFKLPKKVAFDNYRKVGFIVNDLLKEYLLHIKEHSLSQLVADVPIKWVLKFDIQLNHLFEPVSIDKHVLIKPHEGFVIQMSENIDDSIILISVKKKYPKLILDRKELEQVVVSLGMLKELGVYDYKYIYRNLIYKMRFVPLILFKYMNHPAFNVNELTIVFPNDKIFYVYAVKDEREETTKLPFSILSEQAWQDVLIRGIYSNAVKKVE